MDKVNNVIKLQKLTHWHAFFSHRRNPVFIKLSTNLPKINAIFFHIKQISFKFLQRLSALLLGS